MIAQLALSVVLLAGAGLLWRSFYVLYRTEPGLETAGIVTTRLTLPDAKYDTAEKRRRFFDQLEERLAGVITGAELAVATQPPLSPGGSIRELEIEGTSVPADNKLPTVAHVYTGRRYFETLGIRPLHGRLLAENDGMSGREAAVVDEAFAARFFPGGDPIGHRIRLRRANASGDQSWLTVVGVTRSLADFGPPSLRRPVVYVPLRGEPSPGPDVSIVARGADGIGPMVALLREQVRTLDPGLPLYGIETLDAAAARARTPQRLVSTWFGILAFVALVLSTVGVFALTSYGVAQRTREIGMRMALGAQAHQVAWLFLGRTTAHLLIALTIGIFGALTTGRLLQTFLVGTSAPDPLTLFLVVALLALVATAACVIPARRAARLDPVAALRAD